MDSGPPQETPLSARGLRFAVVVSRFNAEIGNQLLAEALACLKELGAEEDALRVVRVPGAFEIPLAARLLCERQDVDAVIALGAIVRGQTAHHQHLGAEVIRALSSLSAETRVPVGLGVLTTETLEQARERSRAGSRDNRGRHAARAAVEMVHLVRKLRR
ncbi:MAG: 6,7-dimethyl-8-ribityllumazine synthase [Acidobacteriota bacterium]